MLFAIYMIDRPHAASLRASVAPSHRAFVGEHADGIYLGGPLMDDDGETIVGSLIVKDFNDRDAAINFISNEPYNKAGLFESVTIRVFNPVVTPS